MLTTSQPTTSAEESPSCLVLTPRCARPSPSVNARAETSRRTAPGGAGRDRRRQARAAQNALRHGMRAEKHIVLPDVDGAEFAALEAALIEELAPLGALQAVLARRVAVAAWRLARAGRIEAELFEQRRGGQRRRARARADPRRQRRALVRDAAALSRRGDGRVLARPAGTLKALQAEQAGGADAAVDGGAPGPFRGAAAARPARAQPNEPERALARPEYLLPEPPASGTLPSRPLRGGQTNPRAPRTCDGKQPAQVHP